MLAGTLLCQAGMKEGRYVTFFPSYGAEMRGGTANCQVILSDSPIGAPVVYEPDILLAFNRPSWERFSPKVRENGLTLNNSSLFSATGSGEGPEVFEVPANRIAEECGSVIATNTVMLGALAARSAIVKLEGITSAVKELLKGKKQRVIDLNVKAAEEGYRFAKKG